MLFNSLDFAIFLPLVFGLYWFVTNRNIKLQNALIVVASYVFYGWWDWRFLGLIAFSTLVDYTIGRSLATQENTAKRKALLFTSITVNLGLLGFFKYYDFFLDNFIAAFSLFGQEIKPNSLNIILPVGISFYTFQTLSYTIDVYKRKLKPTTDFVAFAAFVSFFPQLVAGPIERAANLLPQFFMPRKFKYGNAVNGMRQILWGLFKKLVIADNCAEFANIIFADYTEYNGATLALGAFFFTVQVYGDFSGYSDIAIGTARLFGFNLMQNFAFPFFSRSIAEFWRRWHISLTTWFRDYLYIPLGGSRGGKWLKLRNTTIVFVVCGFWHGPRWTYVIWGALNALYFWPSLLAGTNRKHLEIVAKGKTLPSFIEVLQIAITFLLTSYGLIIFRSENVSASLAYLSEALSISVFSIPNFETFPASLIIIFICALFFLIEWRGREHQYGIEKQLDKWPRASRWVFYLATIALMFWFGGNEEQFIYFQF